MIPAPNNPAIPPAFSFDAVIVEFEIEQFLIATDALLVRPANPPAYEPPAVPCSGPEITEELVIWQFSIVNATVDCPAVRTAAEEAALLAFPPVTVMLSNLRFFTVPLRR